jgi:acyl-CoA hydrolase
MPSTNTNRKTGEMVSRIVPAFEPGTVVTVPSSLTNYVVTEYGIVNLKGKSSWERAEALVSIAHPDFRDELISQCKQANVWRRSNKN